MRENNDGWAEVQKLVNITMYLWGFDEIAQIFFAHVFGAHGKEILLKGYNGTKIYGSSASAFDAVSDN